MKIFGHRGSSGTDPENTMRAFRAALAADADGVELDVHATADGVPVVIHDADVSRTTNGSGAVSKLTLAQLKSLDGGEGERIPTLEEALGLLAGAATFDLEVKQPGIEQIVLDRLDRFPNAEWFISCFDWSVLREIRRLSRTAVLWPLAVAADDDLFAAAAELDSPGIALRHGAYTPEVAGRCSAAGLAVAVWTVNEPAEGRRVRDLGAATLVTDFPAMMRAAILGAEA
jgi:glycerophosphoryl diester phosphodiesterase